MSTGINVPQYVQNNFRKKLKMVKGSYEQKLKDLRPIVMLEASSFINE